MSHSIPYLLSQAAVAAIRAELEPEHVAIRDNPTTPASIAEGVRVVFVEDTQDEPRVQPNQAERRAFTFSVGVINRSADARGGADNDMQRVKRLLARAMPAAARGLKADGELEGSSALRELKRIYKVEGVDVGGALILTQFEVEYTTPNTTLRGRP